MNRIKRQRVVGQFSDGKLCSALNEKNPSTSCIEDLSNEVFYEIFDYFDGCDPYELFSNLNGRFQDLLTGSSLLLKIRFSSTSESALEYRYKKLIIPNKHRIVSLHFCNQSLLSKFFTLCTIDSSFNRLESIVLKEITSFKLVVLLFYLKSLSRLFSLTIYLENCDDDLGDIYQMIFRLSVLKYYKLVISESEELDIDLPIATNEQFSTIEYLVIGHCCTLNELTTILSYTPRLSHLFCPHVSEIGENIGRQVLITLVNLVHISIVLYELQFDEFEEFITKISSQLQSFSIVTRSSDKTYLDGDRWEQLISQYMPQLSKFYFFYAELVNDDFEVNPYHALINRFTSSFWMERQWIFELAVENDELIYLVRPYRESWFDFQTFTPIDTYSNQNSTQDIISVNQQTTVNSPVHDSSAIQFTVRGSLLTNENQSFLDKINPIFEMVQLTRLDVYCSQMSAGMFIKILSFLPTLDSMRVSSLPLPKKMYSSDEDTEILRSILNNTKITKVTLRNISAYEQIDFIIDLFPRMQYLALERISDIDFQLVVRRTLRKMKKNHIRQLITLCIYVEQAKHDRMQKLQKMLDLENRLKNHALSRQYDRFYLQWK